MTSQVSRCDVESPSLAHIAVAGAERSFTLTEVAGYGTIHRLGFADAPVLEIKRLPNPDEPWEIEPMDGARLPDTGALGGELSSWVPAEHHAALGSLIAALPGGEYSLVRHHREATDAGWVLVGNERNARPPAHLAHLLYDSTRGGRYYAGLVGTRAGTAPDLGRPLLGLSVLNFTGQPEPEAGLFVSCFETASSDPNASELLLVVPRSGPLVLDAMARYDDERSAQDLSRWAEERGALFATRLARSQS